jgi:hypothetical protein
LTIDCLANNDLYEAATELLNDVLYNYSGFFTDEHFGSLAALFESPWAEERYQTLLQGDYDYDSLQFGLFMLSFGDAKVLDLIERTDDQSQRFLGRLNGLLTASGYPIGEDHVFVPALEFWSTYVETVTDTMFSHDDPESKQWLPKALAHVMQVVASCWRKIQYPPIEIFAAWDSTDRVGFGDARKDVADLLQAVYTLSGPPLVSLFVDLFLQHLPTRAWAELEAAAYCLSSLSDCISDETKCDDLLDKVFAAPFFELLSQTQGPIPVRLRQTGLSLIERYSEYFERHAQYLPAALNLLFDAVGDPLLGNPSSKSISTLCSSCRALLTGEVAAFLGHYSSIYNGQVIDPLAEERIVLAIASIIQAVPDESQRWQALDQLFSFVKDDVQRSLKLLADPEMLNLSDPLFQRGVDSSQAGTVPSIREVSLQLSLRALRFLCSMAKGMQAVTEGPIDVDGTHLAQPRRNNVLNRIQDEIIEIISRVMSTFPSSGEVVETICNMLRAGFSETESGPFVFPPETITLFFTRQTIYCPRIGALLGTACSFVSSLTGPGDHVVENLSRLLPWVVGLLQSHPGMPHTHPASRSTSF